MKRIRTVLCPVDFSALTQESVRIAVQVCRRTGARLVLHHNMGPAPPDFLGVHWMWDEEHGAEDERREVSVTDEFAKVFATFPDDLEYEAKVSRGPLEAGLLHLADELPADLIVLGSHGPTSAEHRSLTDEIVLRAPCTVLATAEGYESAAFGTAEEGERPLPVLIATDLSVHDRSAVAFGLDLAAAPRYEPHLLHVSRPRRKMSEEKLEVIESEALEALAALVPAELAGRTQLHLRRGVPAEEILAAAAELDAAFVLLGARKHGLLYRTFKGMTSLEVLHHSRWPIWFVPAGRPARRLRDTPAVTQTQGSPPHQPARQGGVMDWKEARLRTIAQWEGIRAGLGRELPVDLVAEVNAVAELCIKAREAAGEPATRCDFCVAFGEVGGCSRVNFQITEALLAEDWERARTYIDEVLELLRDAQLPEPSAQYAS